MSSRKTSYSIHICFWTVPPHTGADQGPAEMNTLRTAETQPTPKCLAKHSPISVTCTKPFWHVPWLKSTKVIQQPTTEKCVWLQQIHGSTLGWEREAAKERTTALHCIPSLLRSGTDYWVSRLTTIGLVSRRLEQGQNALPTEAGQRNLSPHSPFIILLTVI